MRQKWSDRSLPRIRGELERIQRLIDGLYLDWKSGDLNREDYCRMKDRLEEQAQRLRDRARHLEQEENREKGEEVDHLQDFLRRKNIVQLDRGLAVALIEQILVLDGKIAIQFCFPDPCAGGEG